jgi:riboflavin kinase/FMN adenylyltransferase
MKIISDQQELSRGAFADTVVTIGVFDGVHRGHAEVIRTVAAVKGEERRKASVLLTFEAHPLMVTHPEMVPPLLTTLEEKLHILESLDIDVAVIQRFSRETAETDYRTFIGERLIEALGMRHLVVGYDFHLGRGREGSQERLLEEGRRLGFSVTVVPPVVLQGSVVSSTKIRRDIMERRLEHAARCLGRPYFFESEVVRGEGLGRRIGFPTANVRVPGKGKLLPPGGVYAVKAEVSGASFGGMMNIGSAPTLHVDGAQHIEVHLFDFSRELYGERIRVHCLGFVREERRFESAEKLRAQLMQDRETAYTFLEKKH